MNALPDDEPVTLAEACKMFFGGRLKPSSLRVEAAKGNLTIMQIARKDFVTRRAIEEMKEKCRVPASRPDYGSDQKAGTERPSGSSSTAEDSIELAAARLALKRLRQRLPNTSLPGSSKPQKRRTDVPAR